MDKIAVFVDAGYFWVQAGHVVHGRKVGRDKIQIDYAELRNEVLEQAKNQFPNASLLRVYWYDGPGPQGKAPSHHAIDELDDFKLRMGTRNGLGDQKAVDGLIIADIIGLAQSKAIDGAILVSGDADLTPGVIAAQGMGIRVHLLSMGPPNATSLYLQAEVDHKRHWADPTVQKFASDKVLCETPVPAAPATPAQPATAPVAEAAPADAEVDPLAGVADAMWQSLAAQPTEVELEDGAIPRAIDGKLLWMARRTLGRDLIEGEKRSLRKAFKVLLKASKNTPAE